MYFLIATIADLLRCELLILLENLGEITLRRIIEEGCDLRKRIGRMKQKILRFLQLFPMNVLGDSHAHLLFEPQGQATTAQTAVLGKLLQADRFVKMDRDVGNAFLNHRRYRGPILQGLHTVAIIHQHGIGHILDQLNVRQKIHTLAI